MSIPTVTAPIVSIPIVDNDFELEKKRVREECELIRKKINTQLDELIDVVNAIEDPRLPNVTEAAVDNDQVSKVEEVRRGFCPNCVIV